MPRDFVNFVRDMTTYEVPTWQGTMHVSRDYLLNLIYMMSRGLGLVYTGNADTDRRIVNDKFTTEMLNELAARLRTSYALASVAGDRSLYWAVMGHTSNMGETTRCFIREHMVPLTKDELRYYAKQALNRHAPTLS